MAEFDSLIGELWHLVWKTLLIFGQLIFRAFIPVEEKSVKNEIVLITGAGHGIGRELALQYAALGATVVCWGITKNKNEETVEEIARLGYPKAYFYWCDVSDPQNVMNTAKRVQEEVGDVTILVNNAGVAHLKPLMRQTYSEIDHCINVNLKSNFWTILAFLPAMLKNNHGHIVANCSVAGRVGLENGVPYSATKFAVEGMMEGLYKELRLDPKCNVKLTIMYSYYVKTDLFGHSTFRFANLNPMLDPKYVAKQCISAQRRNIFKLFIPKWFSAVTVFLRLFPFEVSAMVYDLLDMRISKE